MHNWSLEISIAFWELRKTLNEKWNIKKRNSNLKKEFAKIRIRNIRQGCEIRIVLLQIGQQNWKRSYLVLPFTSNIGEKEVVN